MSYGRWPKYVSVAEKRAKAEKKIKQLRKKNPNLQPVILTGKALATTWWGKAWNKNLERYADYANRIGRGRSYVRNLAVLDLHISKGKITSLVQGSTSKPYKVKISISPLEKTILKTVKKESAKQLSSLSDLLAGKFPKGLQDIFMVENKGLFPNPKEIKLTCDCPDWADMCKHIAATLYGVGARLDEDPSIFFTLRNITIDDLVAQAVQEKTERIISSKVEKKNSIADDNLGDLFGIDMDTEINFTTTKKAKKKSPGKSKQKSTETSPKPDLKADLILAIIEEYAQNISVKDLAKISGQSTATIYPIVARLKKQQRILNPSRGKYCLNHTKG